MIIACGIIKANFILHKKLWFWPQGSFPLQGWNAVLLVCFIDFFAWLRARLHFKREKVNKRTKNAPFHLVMQTRL